MKRLRTILLAALALWITPASAQVKQSGSVTSGHVSSWATNGVIQDGGTALTPALNTVGILNTGTPFCITDAATSGPYHQLCLGSNVSSAGALLSYNAYGGAAQLPFNVDINGTTVPIGTGTVNSGTGGQLTYYATTGTAVSGAPYATLSSGTLSLGSAGVIDGGLNISGSGSGTISIKPQVAAGTFEFDLPITAGTTGQALVSGGGAGSPMTWATFGGTVNSGSAGQFSYYAGSGTTLSGSSVLSVTGGNISDTGTFTSAGLTSTAAVALSPANANVVLSPTGTGVVTINPATLGTLDNVTVGGTTKAAGGFTTITANTTIAAGSAGVSLGSLSLSGNTGGTIIIKPQASAGSYNFNLPITVGTAGQPLLSAAGGASPMTWGSLSGNTSTFATTSGSLTSGHAATFDGSGNIIDGGALPTGIINSGTAGQLTYYAGSGTTVSGNSNLTVSSGALTLGVTGGTAGSLIFSGSSTGAVTVKGSTTTVGTYNFNLPTTAGSSGNVLASGGGSAAAMTWDTVSGNTTKLATVSGSLTNGNCVAADASGNLIDNGGACGSGGSGTVTSSTATQVAYYAASNNAVAGNSSLTIVGGALTLGVPTTTQGQLKLSGSSTGTITVTGQAAAGTYEFDLPTTAGSSGQFLTSAGGAGAPMTWSTAGLAAISVQNTSFNATSNSAYCVDTSGGAVTATLPASPANNDTIQFLDCTQTFTTNALTIGANTKSIMGTAANMIDNTTNLNFNLTYVSANTNWIMH